MPAIGVVSTQRLHDHPHVGTAVPGLALPSVGSGLLAVARAIAAAAALALPGAGAAAVTDATISMDAPPALPRFAGPAVVAARPRSGFLYAIAATGQGPLTFAATGLPAGLSLAPSTGILSGTMPAVGSYPVAVTVTNALGSASTTLTLVSGDTLSLTPPMGWNSYDSFGGGVTEQEVLEAAQALKTRLQPLGWNYVVVDYLWYDREQVIDANGRFLPSPSRFPSAAGGQGFKPLADRVHALGLLFGIHIMRGVPRKSVTARSPIAGSSYSAADAANTGDACPWDSHMWGVRGDTAAGQAWYDALFAQYAAWDVDFVKVDDMVSAGNYHRSEVDAIRRAIDRSGRSIVLSLSPGPMQTRDAAHLNASANMWRMVNDFWDRNGLSTLDEEFAAAASWQAVQGIEVGHWPDADMLPLGYLGPRCPVHAAGPTALSRNLQVSVMTLWSILPSPLMFGGNVPALSSDAWTTALLTNEEALAINQDALGARARRIRSAGGAEVWARSLSGGRTAVALFNRSSQDAVITASFAELGLSGAPHIRDVWHRRDVTGATTGLSATVPHDSALLFTLSPRDGQAPTAPGAPAATDVTSTSVILTWPASVDDMGVAGYTVYERASPTDASVATVTTTTSSLSGLTPATSYTFYVKARDAAGNVSVASPTVTVTTQGSGSGSSSGGGSSGGGSGSSGASGSGSSGGSSGAGSGGGSSNGGGSSGGADGRGFISEHGCSSGEAGHLAFAVALLSLSCLVRRARTPERVSRHSS